MHPPVQDIIIALSFFSGVMLLPLMPWVRDRLDYDRSLSSVLIYYFTASVLLVYATTTQLHNIDWNYFGVGYSLATLALVFLFGFFWQRHGRFLMPRTPYSDPATTFYDFTLRYAMGKCAEIIFQNIVAVIIVTSIFTLAGQSLLSTGIWFGAIFFVPHIIAVFFFGKEWAWFVLIATLIAGSVPPLLILTVPSGVLLMMCFHISVYMLFLMIMRRLALQNKVIRI